MDFGMFTEFNIRRGETQAQAFEDSFTQVDAAEQMGMDSLWLAEHHFSPERSVLSSPLVIASAIASRTRRIRVGLAVQVLPLVNPLRVAEQAATVDHISKGRLDFGIGRSGLTKYYDGYHVEYAESRGRFFEALEIIMKAWTSDGFSHEGEYYTFNDVNVVPKPYQKPHPPTRIAVASVDTFPMVGGLGYPIFIMATIPIPQLKERLKLYRQAWKDAGHPGLGDVLLQIPAYVAETPQRARSEPEASTVHAIRYRAQELLSTVVNPEVRDRIQRNGSASYDEILQGRVMYGTPEAVTECLQMYEEELGISGMVLETNFGGEIPTDRVTNSIRLFTEKVAPNFK